MRSQARLSVNTEHDLSDCYAVPWQSIPWYHRFDHMLLSSWGRHFCSNGRNRYNKRPACLRLDQRVLERSLRHVYQVYSTCSLPKHCEVQWVNQPTNLNGILNFPSTMHLSNRTYWPLPDCAAWGRFVKTGIGITICVGVAVVIIKLLHNRSCLYQPS